MAAISQSLRSKEHPLQRHGRPRLPGVVLLFAAALAMGAGLWGALAPRVPVGPQVPARVGEAIEVPGGLLQVDNVIAEHMAPMHADKFAGSGMSMSGMGMDMAPKGQRRFTVQLTLASQGESSLRYSADQFQVTGTGLQATTAYRYRLGDGVVPSGNATSGNLLFQVPESATELLLSFRGGQQSIALDPKTGTGQESHSHHGGESSGDHTHGK